MSIPTGAMPTSPGRKVLSFGESDTSKNFTFKGCPGVLLAILLEAYDTTNNVTRTVTLTDPNGVTLFSKASLADAANTLISIRSVEAKDVPIMPSGTYTLTVTMSAPGNAGIDYVTLFII